VTTAFAPGRVNLIGDHTDTTGGLVLPMAIDLGTTIELERGGDEVVLTSSALPGEARVPLDVADPAAAEPAWARYVAGVVAELRPAVGLRGHVRTTLPVGAGLSSSAALEVAVAVGLAPDQPAVERALACQRAEQRASGVPCGVMDQLASAAGVDGHALLVDCTTLAVTPVPLPAGIEVVVVHSGQARELAGSAYAARRAACEAAEAIVGPLRHAAEDDLLGVHDPVIRRRARHVVRENARVRAAAAALRDGDVETVGRLLVESHHSLRDDFEVSTPALDAVVDRLVATPGVLGARLTGAGFGGCAVALAEPGAVTDGWTVRASSGAALVDP
jgi:galactokinase